MKLDVLGCAGGIGGRERLTTCMRIDNDITLDAGTGLCALDIDQLEQIDHIFLTHFHLDHVAGLALLVDAVQGRRSNPITIYATGAVIASLQKNLFNWELWPDFAAIPNRERPAMRWSPLEVGQSIELNGRIITPHHVNHTRGSVAYWVHNHRNGFLFSGDMATTPELWASLAREPKLRQVIVDCSFPNADAGIAQRSFHYCPQSLIADTEGMPDEVDFLIYHLKPGQEDTIMQELRTGDGGRAFTALRCGDQFQF